jgi:hypothetical protein
MLNAMTRWAFIVRTSAGSLQMQRLGREQGMRLRSIFLDEAEAISYLLNDET